MRLQGGKSRCTDPVDIKLSLFDWQIRRLIDFFDGMIGALSKQSPSP